MAVVDYMVSCGWCGKKFVPGRGFLRALRKGRKLYCSRSHGARDNQFRRRVKKVA
jgi:ribosomal protein L24E